MQSWLAKFFAATFALAAALAVTARAETQVVLEGGWGAQPRAGRWTPVFVTASDSKTRNVTLNLSWPVGGNYTMHVQQAMTIDSTPRTFPLILPVHGWSSLQPELTLSDSDSGKTLAHFPTDPESPTPVFSGTYADQNSTFAGLSGSPTGITSFRSAMTGTNLGFLPTDRLPTAPLGYDALDVLILNEPALVHANFGPAALDDEQQQAIVDWVRAGGKLILWPGNAGLPARGVLADVLPGKVVGAENIELSPADLDTLGLPKRFQKLAVHRIEPRADSERLPMLNQGQIAAYSCNYGLGKIVLVPVNIAAFQVDDATKCRNLWRPILKGIIEIPQDKPAPDTQPTSPYMNYGYGNNNADSRDTNASMQIADFLGDVPGAGQFGSSYVVYVLIGLMIVVGPVDWLVLKKLGRQPWTWVTTTGWIALITTGALFAGYMFKSGDLHYRTLSTVDQVGNATVAGTDYVSLYSSRTRSYVIKTDGDSWWQPGAVSDYGGSGLKLDMDFHQTNQGNTPEDMVVNVWSLRFLRGEHIGAGPPMISAKLHRSAPAPNGGSSNTHIVGTITNLSDRPLTNVRIEVREGTGEFQMTASTASATAPAIHAVCKEIQPHETVNVTVMPVPDQSSAPQVDQSIYRGYSGYNSSPVPVESTLWKTASELAYRRGKLMSDRLTAGTSAIVYASVEDPVPGAALMSQKAIERHYQFLRALVDLQERGK